MSLQKKIDELDTLMYQEKGKKGFSAKYKILELQQEIAQQKDFIEKQREIGLHLRAKGISEELLTENEGIIQLMLKKLRSLLKRASEI